MPSAQQLLALNELKKRLTDLDAGDDQWKLQNDVYLAHWLMLHHLKVDKAEAAIKKSYQWRKEIGANGKFEGISDKYFKKFPFDSGIVDKMGIPVVYVPICRWDMASVLEQHGSNLIHQYTNCMDIALETVWLKTQLKLGKEAFEAPQLVDVILNLKDFPLRQFTSLRVIEAYIKMIKDQTNYYLPGLGKCIVLNMSKFYYVAFSMVKPFLQGLKMDLHIFDNNVDKWRPFLLGLIDEAQLYEDFEGPRKLPESTSPCL